MGRKGAVPIEHEMEEMWQLADDRRSVRMSLQGLPIADMPELLRISVDFGADVIDQMIERLAVLRAQMLPEPAPARRHN